MRGSGGFLRRRGPPGSGAADRADASRDMVSMSCARSGNRVAKSDSSPSAGVRPRASDSDCCRAVAVREARSPEKYSAGTSNTDVRRISVVTVSGR
ncbi:hypothetical protein CHAN_11275 [Corynebacterium hansenii]|nr:hypothetical protein CHAN_11275 [Corynebacterium hansenii]